MQRHGRSLRENPRMALPDRASGAGGGRRGARLRADHYVRKQVSSGRYTHSYYYLLPLDGPASPLAQAIADLIAGRGGRQAPGGKFQRMLDHIAGEDKQVRDFAASFASVNGWGYIGCPAQRAQPDAFAQALLAAGDRSTQRRMARAYSAARADLLPRDAKLLKQVFLHPDPEVVTPVLRGGLGRAAGRSDVLAPLVRPCLVDPGRNAQRRGDVLHALTQWQDKALLFRAELERIARGKPSPAPDYAHRLVALRLLLDAKVDNAHELVDHTLVGVPSAVALEYAVEHELRGIVPAAIRAVREGKLTWSQTHSSALSLLTRRFPEGTFEQFDGWWRRIESAGREKPMLASGFVNAELNARARKLIEQLGSGRYRHRRAARKQLTKLGTAIVPALRAATRHADRQIADSAGHLLARAEASFKSCRDRLAGAAKKERGGGLILQPAGAHPGTDQPKATSSPARKTAPPPP